MSISGNLNNAGDNFRSGNTFVFPSNEEMRPDFSIFFASRLWQVVPCFFGSVLCLSFGLMLGWPSPTYPLLLSEDSPIPISLDQSAMIAGFLMIGMVISTPFSSWSFLGTKYGIILGYAFAASGWACMWTASNIYWLLGSRLLIGMGNGYGSGQLKMYIKELCDHHISAVLVKLLNLVVFLGVVAAFCVGPFVSFEHFSLIALVLTLLFLVLCLFIPHTPKELCYLGKIEHAMRLLQILRPNLNASHETKKIKDSLALVVTERTFVGIIGDGVLRRRFALVALLVFFQQFSGAPATVVYSQIIFETSGCPNSEFCAIAYALVMFLSSIFAAFYSSGFHKKKCLLLSATGVSLVLLAQILVVHFEVNQKLWRYASLLVMAFYITAHTVGLGIVPFVMAQSFFPKTATRVLVNYYVMSFSAFALIVTKIFQVIFDRFCLEFGFLLFLLVSLTSVIFVLIFVPNGEPEVIDDGVAGANDSVKVENA